MKPADTCADHAYRIRPNLSSCSRHFAAEPLKLLQPRASRRLSCHSSLLHRCPMSTMSACRRQPPAFLWFAQMRCWPMVEGCRRASAAKHPTAVGSYAERRLLHCLSLQPANGARSSQSWIGHSDVLHPHESPTRITVASSRPVIS